MKQPQYKRPTLVSVLSPFVLIFGLNANAQTATTANVSRSTQFSLGELATAKVNLLIQGWSIQNENDSPNNQNFRLRRTEIKLSGAIANAPKYFFMIDPSKLIPLPNGKPIAANNMIQDVGIGYGFAPGFEITVGQFKAPTTAEGLDSSSDLQLPERSLVGRTIGDKREMGVKLTYKQTFWNATAMVSSGRYLTAAAEGMFNDIDTRIEFTPNKQTSFGTFLVMGAGFDYNRKGRWGANARYHWGNAELRAEYAQAKDKTTHSHGTTLETGYWINDNLEPVARYETYTPAQSAKNSGRAETLGVNYYFRNYFAKLQLAASALQNMSAATGSPTYSNGTDTKEVTLALQVAI